MDAEIIKGGEDEADVQEEVEEEDEADAADTDEDCEEGVGESGEDSSPNK